jgi:hypothetical protein
VKPIDTTGTIDTLSKNPSIQECTKIPIIVHFEPNSMQLKHFSLAKSP